MDDKIVSFLKSGKYKDIILKSLLWKGKYPEFLISRVVAVFGLLRGFFSMKEFVNLLLPPRFKKEKLKTKFSSFLNEGAREALKQFINEDNSVNFFGNKFYASGNNFFELASLLLEIVIFDQYHLQDYLGDGDVIIDAGANIGTFSVFAGNLKNNITVHAFEPARKTFEILQKNSTPYKNIFLYDVGLGDTKETKKLFSYEGSTCGSTFEDSGMIKERQNEINGLLEENAKITTVDDFVFEKKIVRLDFIKIDTEGYELQILKGGAEAIKKFKPVISVSAYHHASDKEEIPKLLLSICEDYKYKVFNESEEDMVFFV